MNSRKSAGGFSIVELLVGVTVGLIGCVIIFQVLSVNEGYKRSTTGGADAQVAGALGLFALEREIKMAGYGINDRTILGCNMVGYTSTRTPNGYNLAAVPVQIHPGATAATPDIISINTGNPLDFAPGYGLSAANMAPGANFRMENRAGVRPFDFLLAANPATANCTLLNAVNLPLEGAAGVTCGGSLTTDAVEVCAGVSKTDYDGVARIYNRGGGIAGAPTYTLGTGALNTRFFNLGTEPTFNVYRIINNTLSVCNMRLADCGNIVTAANWSPVIENVVFMKAQYGMDTNDDGIVDTFHSGVCRDTSGPVYDAALGNNFGEQWTFSSDTDANGLHDTWAPGPPSAIDWSRVLAIRVALVVRSAQYEKTDLATGFNTVAGVIKLWPDAKSNSGCTDSAALNTAPTNVIGDPNTGPSYTIPDQKYRYRVFETIIPLRNAIWLPG